MGGGSAAGGISGQIVPAQTTPGPEAAAGCGRVTVFDTRSQWAAMPKRTRAMLRSATLPMVRAIISDPGIGLSELTAGDVPLAAVELGRPEPGVVLYAVSWRDQTFGVNGKVWLVEVDAARAADLTPMPSREGAAFGMGGFGVAVLSARDAGYPEVMVASKGYDAEVGVEAGARCLRKTGHRYSKVPCPARCPEVLDRR